MPKRTRVRPTKSESAVGQPGALGKDARPPGDPVALADGAADRQARPVVGPIDAVSEARAVFPPVVAGEAVEREQVAVLKIDRPRVLVGDRQVRRRRRRHHLQPRSQPLEAAEQGPDQRPLHVGGERGDGPRVPAVGAAIDRHDRLFGVGGVIDVAAPEGGQRQLLPPWRQPVQIPFARWRRRAGCPVRRCAGSPGCWLGARPCRRAAADRAAGARRSPAARSGSRFCTSSERRPWKAHPAIEM